MKLTDEVRWATENLKEEINGLIDEFIGKYGECSVEIHTTAKFIEIARGRSIYAGHEVEVNIVI